MGVGSLVATTAALVAEYAPRAKNTINAITNGGIPLGSLLSALLAILLMDKIGWRGMFWIGALPLVTAAAGLVQDARSRLPGWRARRMDEARALSERTGVPVPEAPTQSHAAGRGRQDRLRRPVRPTTTCSRP